MSRYEDIEEAKKEIAEAEKYLLSLSDKDYAALHVAMQVENLEKEIERKKEELLELQAQSCLIGLPPDVPKKYNIWMEMFNRTAWRWIGKRSEQEKAYKLKRGSLTDGGW